MNRAPSLLTMVVTIILACGSPCSAQPIQFDLGGIYPGQTNSNKPQTLSANQPAGSAQKIRLAGVAMPGSLNSGNLSSATGNFSNPSYATGEGPSAMGGITAGRTRNQKFGFDYARTNTLAPNSVNMYPIPSGTFDYGFPKTGPSPYLGTSGTSRKTSLGGMLPQTATSSVDLNICDAGTLGGGGASGGGGDGTGGGDGGSGQQAPPDLPPGWAAVMCHGIYAGAIPPGGTVLAFWQGAYGFAGDAAQQAALKQEGEWLIANGEVGQ